jgi:hypothetical protein
VRLDFLPKNDWGECVRLALVAFWTRRACIAEFAGGYARMQFSTIRSRLRRDGVVLVAFAAVAGFYLLASALSHVLPLNAPRVSFLTVLRGLEWGHAFSTDFLVQAILLVPAGGLMVVYTLSASRGVRLACGLTGWLLPLFILWDGVPEIGRWLMAIPRAFSYTYEALAGHGGGQFYGDGPMFFTAVGWWLFLCFVLTIREAVFRSKHETAS